MSNLHERLSELSTNVRELAVLTESIRRNPDTISPTTTPYRVIIDNLKKLLEKLEKEDKTFKLEAPVTGTNSALLRRQNISFKMAPRVDMHGVSWVVEDGIPLNKRLSPVVTVHHIDAERDRHLNKQLGAYNLNYVFAQSDDRDYKLKFSKKTDPKYLPKKSDLRPNFGNILDQSTLGASSIHAVAYAVRFLSKKKDWTPSRLYMYWYARKEAELPTDLDTGVSIRDAFRAVTHNGVCSEGSLPYDVNTFNQEPPSECHDEGVKFPKIGYFTIDQNGPAIKKCLKDGYPVNFGCVVYSGFMTENAAKTGNIPAPDNDQHRCGCHTLTIVGHDDSEGSFIVANSWGSDWGDGGFCKMPYEYVLDSRYASDFWTSRLV